MSESSENEQKDEIIITSKSSPSLNNDEKLKQVIKQLYQNNQELKTTLEKKCNQYDIDIKLLNEEKLILKDENIKLSELLAKKNENSNFEEKMLIYQKQISDLTSQLRISKLENTDLQLNNQVLQKQVEQYEKSISNLEYDLSRADADRYQLSNLKTQVSTLEDEIRQKTRQIKELETSYKWNQHELQKLKGRLAINNSKTNILTFENIYSDSIPSTNSSLYILINNLYQKLEKSQKNLSNNEIFEFFNKLVSEISILKDENERLLQLISNYKHKYAKLKGPKNIEENINIPSTEKLIDLVKKLMNSNKEKTEKIKILKDIAERQHLALQKIHEK